jgi:hypothetical protein
MYGDFAFRFQRRQPTNLDDTGLILSHFRLHVSMFRKISFATPSEGAKIASESSTA